MQWRVAWSEFNAYARVGHPRVKSLGHHGHGGRPAARRGAQRGAQEPHLLRRSRRRLPAQGIPGNLENEIEQLKRGLASRSELEQSRRGRAAETGRPAGDEVRWAAGPRRSIGRAILLPRG